MELKVLNIEGNETGRTYNLPESVFGIEPNDHAIYLDVKQYLANQRQGTHKSKERAEVHKSTRKLKRQKGTGGARAGSAKSPLMKGGGRIFGPRPRDYSFKLNKKVKNLARLSALSYKAKENNIVLVDAITLENPNTKTLNANLKNLNLGGVKTLVILSNIDRNTYLSSRNLPKCKVTTISDVNTYDIMNAKQLLFVESSIKDLEKSE
jgi:large subunit ribosomal protein L4